MNVITTLKKLGCKVVSRETTAGAQKWWLTYPLGTEPGNGTVKKVRDQVRRLLGLTEDGWENREYITRQYTLIFQSEAMDEFFGIFVAKPHNTNAGRDTQQVLPVTSVDQLEQDETIEKSAYSRSEIAIERFDDRCHEEDAFMEASEDRTPVVVIRS